MALKTGWRALPPALAGHSCGCFLPDLTRFTTLQCGEARQTVRMLEIALEFKRFLLGGPPPINAEACAADLIGRSGA